jgi:exopolysaccharide biosynthesis polyprenyl glycosylphosphotransferase
VIRRHVTVLRLVLALADGAAAIILFAAISAAVLGPTWRAEWLAKTGIEPIVPALAYAVGWVVASWLLGLYRIRARWTVVGDLRESIRLGAIVSASTVLILFALNLDQVSRPLVVALLTCQVAVTFISRFVIRRLFGWFRIRGYNMRQILIVGTGRSAASFADLIERHPELGLNVMGFLRAHDEDLVAPGPILGGIEAIEAIFHDRVVDEVAICLPVGQWEFIEPVTVLCREEGKVVRIPLGDIGLAWPAGGRVEEFDGLPILSHVQVPDQVVGMIVKRLVDIALAIVGLLVLSPVFAATAVSQIATAGRPVLFRQVRVGMHGRPFTIVKFRTMVADAEMQYANVVAMSDTQGAAFKMTDDPRITRVGRFLRKTSIDELPQLWNVLRGEMSIVGPRPAPPREVAEYDIWHRRRLSMKPGITGLWQVEARLDESFDRRAILDLRYIDGWSFWLDMKIIARTIPAMFQGR